MRVEYRVLKDSAYMLESWLNERAAEGFRLHSVTPREGWTDHIIAVVVRQVHGGEK